MKIRNLLRDERNERKERETGKRKKRRSSNIKLEGCSWCKHKRILRRKIDTLKQFASFPFVFRVIPSFFIENKYRPTWRP